MLIGDMYSYALWKRVVGALEEMQRTPATSGLEGNPEDIGTIPNIRGLTSGIGGKLTVRRTYPRGASLANSGLRPAVAWL